MQQTFKILSVNISIKKGTTKKPVDFIELVENSGILGDAHAAPGDRQVSMLANEDIDKMLSLKPDLKPGDFAENITTEGVDLPSLPIGTRIIIGNAILEVSKIGKECHHGCEIMQKTGTCIMPKRGIFAAVIKGGKISNEDIGYYSL